MRVVGRAEALLPDENAHHRAPNESQPDLRSTVPRNSRAQDIEFGVEQFVAARKECVRHNFCVLRR